MKKYWPGALTIVFESKYSNETIAFRIPNNEYTIKDQEEFVFPVSEEHLTTIVKMVEDKLINKTIALDLMTKVIETQKDPMVLAKEISCL